MGGPGPTQTLGGDEPNLPSLSSPKLPHPIFFPTRKLGPTMRTPELEDMLCRLVCMPVRPPPPPPALDLDTRLFASSRLLSFSLSLPSRFCILYHTQGVNTSLAEHSLTRKGIKACASAPVGPRPRPAAPGVGLGGPAIQPCPCGFCTVPPVHCTLTIKKCSQPTRFGCTTNTPTLL